MHIEPLQPDDEQQQEAGKVFGLRYHQLIVVLLSLIAATQLYTWMNPIQVGGHDIRLYLCLFIALIGPTYCFFYRKEAMDIKSIWPHK